MIDEGVAFIIPPPSPGRSPSRAGRLFFNPRIRRIPQSNAPRRRARVEVRDALYQHGARDAEEERAVEPVVADTLAAVNRERDGELVEPEPAVEGEADLDRLAATKEPQVHLLLLRVRAVRVYAAAVVDEEAYHRVVRVAVEARTHAQCERRARLHDARLSPRRVEKLRADNLGRAVAVTVVVSERRQSLALARLVFGPFRLRRLVLVSLLALHHDLLVVVENLRGRAVVEHAPRAEQYRARAEGAHRGRVVRDEEHGRAALLNLLYAPQAAVLEDGVADGERLVDDEYVGLDV